jgi:hypothetical protein
MGIIFKGIITSKMSFSVVAVPVIIILRLNLN